MHNTNLWSPWRYEYLRKLKTRAEEFAQEDSECSNFLIDYWDSPQDDERNMVVFRNNCGIILLNRYPYANGHLLVALSDPKPTLLEYSAEQLATFWNLVEHAVRIMQTKLQPQGVNIGINEGDAAGAGLPQHIHAHVVPRWRGDTNFMASVGNTRVVPASLEEMWLLFTEINEQTTPVG